MSIVDELLPGLIVSVYPTDMIAPLVLIRDIDSSFMARARNEDTSVALEEACTKLVRFRAVRVMDRAERREILLGKD